MKLKLNQKTFYFKLSLISINIILIFIYFLIGYDNIVISNIFASGTLVFSIINFYLYRNNFLAMLLHLQLVYLNYSVVFSRYIHIVPDYDSFYANADSQILGIGIVTMYIFELCMFLFFVAEKQKSNLDLSNENPNSLIALGLVFVIVFIAIFYFDWSLIGQRGAVTAVYEYITVLLIIAFYYMGKNKVIKILYFTLIILLCIQGLVYGERISALQFILIFVIYNLSNILSYKKVILFSIIGVLIMSIVGTYRGEYSIEGVLSNTLSALSDRYLTFNGADLGYYASLTFVMYSFEVEWLIRLELFGKFLWSLISGGSEESNLSLITRNYYTHWNGGFLPLHFYFYGGMLGVFMSGTLISRLLTVFFEHKYKFLKLASVYVVATTFRWYAYDPLNLFRGLLILGVLYLLCEVFNGVRKRKK